MSTGSAEPTVVAPGLLDPGDEGLFLWNILFDPREIFDLLSTMGLSEDDVARRLTSTVCAAFRGWSAQSVW